MFKRIPSAPIVVRAGIVVLVVFLIAGPKKW